MKLLAIDTSTEACSAALHVDGETTSRYELAPRRHAELILPMIDNLLSEAQLSLKQLDAIGFGRGPGAFTGVRIAAGIAQGLAFSSDLPVIPVSSLAALAQAVKDKADYIAAAIDARMEEIYYGLYKSGRIVELTGEECVITPDKLYIDKTLKYFGVGSGWSRHKQSLTTLFADQLISFADDQYPHAADVATLAIHAYKQGIMVKPEDALPVYLRNNVTG